MWLVTWKNAFVVIEKHSLGKREREREEKLMDLSLFSFGFDSANKWERETAVVSFTRDCD